MIQEGNEKLDALLDKLGWTIEQLLSADYRSREYFQIEDTYGKEGLYAVYVAIYGDNKKRIDEFSKRFPHSVKAENLVLCALEDGYLTYKELSKQVIGLSGLTAPVFSANRAKLEMDGLLEVFNSRIREIKSENFAFKYFGQGNKTNKKSS